MVNWHQQDEMLALMTLILHNNVKQFVSVKLKTRMAEGGTNGC